MNKIIKKEIADIAKKLGINYSTIREFQDKVNWGNISRNQKLSEDFIREFQDKVVWFNISSNQKLSEDFIREFQDKVYWYNIFRNQKLSEDFIRKFSHKLNPIKMIFPDNSCETIFMFNQKVELGSKIYSKLNKKYFVVVEMSDDRKEVWLDFWGMI